MPSASHPLRLLLNLSLAAAAWLPLPALAFVFAGDAVEGRVVDASSGQPLEGVLVAANWQLEGGLDTGIPRGHIQILEATTSTAGAFRLPSWGPRFSVAGHASSQWPQILLFKPGYEYRVLANRPRSGSQYTTVSEWNGKTIALRAMPDLPQYVKAFDALNRDVDGIGVRSGDLCAWRELPVTIRTLAMEAERLRGMGLRNFRDFADDLRFKEEFFAKQGCGSAKEFLRSGKN
jgi:hypothetical protein